MADIQKLLDTVIGLREKTAEGTERAELWQNLSDEIYKAFWEY